MKIRLSIPEIILIICILLSCGTIKHRPKWPDLSRFFLVMAVVNDHVFYIDDNERFTGDKSFYNNHYYTDKAPGLSLIAVPVYQVVSFAEPLIRFTMDNLNKLIGNPPKTNWGVTNIVKLWVTRTFTVSFFSAIFAVIFWRFLKQFSVNARFALTLTVGYVFGTTAFPYSTVFYGHQVCAVICFIMFIMIVKWLTAKKLPDRCEIFLFGLLTGTSLTIEYPTLLIIAILYGFLIFGFYNIYIDREIEYRQLLRELGFLILGFSIPIAIFAAYNYYCYDSPFSIGYDHLIKKKFADGMSEGVEGVTYPRLGALWGITFSPFRGIFVICPFLLLVFPAWYYLIRNISKKNYLDSLPYFTASAIVIIYFLFNASYKFWDGGWGIGPRHVVPVIPFLVFLLTKLKSKWFIPLAVMVAVSCIFMIASTLTDPEIPDSFKYPLLEYTLPRLTEGKVSLTPFFFLKLPGHLITGIYFSGIAIAIFLIYFLSRNPSCEGLVPSRPGSHSEHEEGHSDDQHFNSDNQSQKPHC